jgi:hypothetical protein
MLPSTIEFLKHILDEVDFLMRESTTITYFSIHFNTFQKLIITHDRQTKNMALVPSHGWK